jgi:hypothetical protein
MLRPLLIAWEDFLATMEDEQGREKKEPARLSINGQVFLQKARANDYVLYQSQETRTFGRLVVDLFLEYIPGIDCYDQILSSACSLNSRVKYPLISSCIYGNLVLLDSEREYSKICIQASSIFQQQRIPQPIYEFAPGR